MISVFYEYNNLYPRNRLWNTVAKQIERRIFEEKLIRGRIVFCESTRLSERNLHFILQS